MSKLGRHSKESGLYRPVVYQEDIVDEIAALPRIIDNGISRDLISLIIEDYQDRKVEELIEGKVVDERGLGRTSLILRRVAPNIQSKTDKTIKSVTILSPRSRAIILDRVNQDTEEAGKYRYLLSNGNIS